MSFEIRAATPEHHAALCELARYLNSVNLPDDPQALQLLLETSEQSFSRSIADPARREYVFVIRDVEAERVVGTSMVIGQLGRRDAPYIYFDVRTQEKYSATLDKHFVHTILASTYVYNGPTEIGGLVVHPDYRRRPERVGAMIAYVRFLFIKARRADMREQLLAELLPPLERDGTSLLWEAVGRRFTGLSYAEADRLSRRNKEFIRGLFPDEIYATLLSDEAQRVIGQVGDETKGVEKMLRRVGFEYANRVDPFDGGPHFVAATDRVTAVERAHQAALQVDGPPAPGSALVAVESVAPPYFVARGGWARGPDQAVLTVADAAELGLEQGDRVWLLPVA